MKQRKTLRETLIENQRGLNAWGAAFGKAPMKIDIKPKRSNTKVTDDSDRESAVIREVGELLAVHPNVMFAVRQNSGMSYNEVGAPIWFYRWVRSRAKMRLPDFWGMLTDGRLFALECKRRNWKSPSGEREGEQQNFLMTVRNCGGVSGFVTSSEQAKEVLG